MSEIINEYIKKIGTKNLIIIGIVFISIITCAVIGSLIYYNFFYKKSFSEIEDIMVNAAKSYYSKNEDELPENISESTQIEVNTLVSQEYMKDIANYTKDENITCDASVNVTNINNTYRYTPLLDCGDDYTYETIVNHIKEKEPIVTEGEGLYQIDNDLVFRGEKLKNYVKFADHNWRIIKISDDKIYLILTDTLDRTIWDDRYNNERDNNYGINDYNVSRIRDYLNNLYTGDSLFNDENKLLLANFNLNIGKVGETEDGKSAELEKSNIIENQYIGLITVRDFMNASLDANCKTPENTSCTNYNFISDYDYNFFTMTGDKSKSYNVYQISKSSGLYLTRASYRGYVRPVISITKDALYVSGTGTSKKPYRFK